MSIIICGRTLTKDGKVSYCRNKAYYVTPPGKHTGRVINVCERCKQEIIDKTSGKHTSKDFQKL